MNVNLFKAAYVAAGYTQKTLCKAMQVNPGTVSRWYKYGNMPLNMVRRFISLCNVENPVPIFFTDEHT